MDHPFRKRAFTTDAEYRAEQVLLRHGVDDEFNEEANGQRDPSHIDRIVADIRRINGKPIEDEDPEC